jgi:hypothetical protein
LRITRVRPRRGRARCLVVRHRATSRGGTTIRTAPRACAGRGVEWRETREWREDRSSRFKVDARDSFQCKIVHSNKTSPHPRARSSEGVLVLLFKLNFRGLCVVELRYLFRAC